MDPSMIWALKRKQMVEGRLITHRNVFRETKKQNLQTEITMHFHTLSVPASPCLPFHLLCSSISATHHGQPFLFLLLFSLLSKKVMGMKTYMMIHFHSMSSK